MTDIIEVTDDITFENFAVDPSAMRDFLETHSHVDTTADTNTGNAWIDLEEISEIKRISLDALRLRDGFSNFLHIDYAPGVYDGELPDCGWIKVED